LTPPLLRPEWPAPGTVGAACSLREGGVSAAPFDTLNLGDHVGDDEAPVAENRRRFVEALDGARPVFLKQVHGREVAELTAATPDGTQADACFTRERRVACTIMVADCLPLLFADERGTQVGAAHAGWRGLADGVIEALAAHFEPARTLVWLGPCIGPANFEVGAEVKAAFEADDRAASAHFAPREGGKWLANLPALARMRLARAGLQRVFGNEGSPAWCTVGNPSRFFSHRRDRISGRFAAAVWMR
jgi:YfiH family protein